MCHLYNYIIVILYSILIFKKLFLMIQFCRYRDPFLASLLLSSSSLPPFPHIITAESCGNSYKFNFLLFQCLMALQVQAKVQQLASYCQGVYVTVSLGILLLFGNRDKYCNVYSLPSMDFKMIEILEKLEIICLDFKILKLSAVT